MKKNRVHFAVIIFFFICNFFVKNAYSTVLENGDELNQDNLEGTRLDVATEESHPFGVTFNNDGTKMFMVGERSGTDAINDDIHQYVLSTPYDISTATFSTGIEVFSDVGSRTLRQIQFSNDGSKMFFTVRCTNNNDNCNKIFQYSLSIKFDISTATYSEISYVANETNAGLTGGLIGFAFNNDGTMMFLSDGIAAGGSTEKVYQLSLEKPFDLSGSVTVIRSVDLETLEDDAAHQDFDGETEPSGIAFNEDGTRMFLIGQKGNDVNQYTLSVGFNISTASFDGGLEFGGSNNNPSGIAFSPSGLKMFSTNNAGIGKLIRQFTLPCPFNFFAGKCQSISKGDRTGIAEAQINIAKRTIEYSTDTALNRLKWIRRNKDLQDLSSRNIKLNFSNEMLASLSKAIQVSTTSKEKNKEKDVFYWSEGSLAFGKVRKTDTSSKKKIYTDGITIGADKFTDGQGIKGLAFRYSQNNVKVGTVGSELDTDTYNLTYYSTTPVKDDSRFLDTVVGIGFLESDITSIVESLKLNGKRNGRQIYGTLKLKEEIKKENLTLIPAGQIDLGYTLLGSYSESGKAGMNFDKQSITSRNLRLSIASVEELNNKKYKMKRHGKIEYKANLHRPSNINYSYTSDSTSKFETKLNSDALHNINGEIGVDVIYDENFSLFLIYEHNRALGRGYSHKTGYTNKIHVAIGYLPQKNTNLVFKIEGEDILRSKYIYTKNINGLDIEFYLMNHDVMRPKTFKEMAINLKKVF